MFLVRLAHLLVPLSAHNKPRYAVPLGKKEEHAMCVSVNHNGDCYDIYMRDFLPNATEFAYLSALPASAAELEKWKLADLSEVKSLVLEHDVWDGYFADFSLFSCDLLSLYWLLGHQDCILECVSL